MAGWGHDVEVTAHGGMANRGSIFWPPLTPLSASPPTRRSEQIEIATSHEIEACADKTDGPIA
jgi:hypothetical protein